MYTVDKYKPLWYNTGMIPLERKNMKFSVFTAVTPEYGIDEAVKVVKETGYDGIEWRVSAPAPEVKPDNYSYETRYRCYNRATLDVAKIETQAELVKNACDKFKLQTCMMSGYSSIFDLSSAERLLKAANMK